MEKDLPLTRLHKDRLLDCFEQRFCPVCRAIWQLDTKRFDWYVNDGVLDEETLRLVVQAAGFCAPHTMALALIEGKDFLWSHLGSSLVQIEILTKLWIPTLQRALAQPAIPIWRPWSLWLSPSWHHLLHPRHCPLCFDHQQQEDSVTNAFLQLFASDPVFRQAYQTSDGLCLPHSRQIRPFLEPSLARDLDGEAHAEKILNADPGSEQVRALSAFLFGADMLLWSDARKRVADRTLTRRVAPCQICRESQQQDLASFPRFLASLPASPRPLSLCPHHLWWWQSQCQAHPRLATHAVALLHTMVWETSCGTPGGKEQEEGCLLCRRKQAQEMPLLLEALHAARDQKEPVPDLCVQHGRLLLQEYPQMDGAAAFVARALLTTLTSLLQRLQSYTLHCNEHLQVLLQPEERLG